MITLSNPGTITNQLYCLGPAEVPSVLLDGERPVVFEAGVYMYGPHYLNEIQKVLGTRAPAYLFLTHMHYDHCGAAGYLKRMLPGLEIGASQEGCEIIRKPSAIDLITRLNDVTGSGGTTFEPFDVDLVLSDGDIIRVSDACSVEIVKTPGHTRDMLSYYIPELKTLIPSESVGVPASEEYIFSEFLIDYDTYMKSLERLSGYDVDILIIAHGVYLTGDHARRYIPRSKECAVRFRSRLEDLVAQYGDDFESIAQVVKAEEYDTITGPKQPEESYLINLKAKVKTVARHMREREAVRKL
jgi:glyoxylase-like metal-dependent hydrolase (beta-lactamase superfamily II)